jgi:hypothetical protein
MVANMRRVDSGISFTFFFTLPMLETGRRTLGVK